MLFVNDTVTSYSTNGRRPSIEICVRRPVYAVHRDDDALRSNTWYWTSAPFGVSGAAQLAAMLVAPVASTDGAARPSGWRSAVTTSVALLLPSP